MATGGARWHPHLPTAIAAVTVGAVVVGGVLLARAMQRLCDSLSEAHAALDEYRVLTRLLKKKATAKKPKYIILVRHGESMGNIDEEAYRTIPDSRVKLTPKGEEQAREAGRKLRALLKGRPVWSFCSPYERARQTAHCVLSQLEDGQVLQHREDPRVREQEFKGTFQDDDMHGTKEERWRYGSFFFRFPNGESAADVYDRVSIFMDTLWRDFHHFDLSDAAVVIFTHGLTARIFLMRWFRWTTDDFERTRNPKNGTVIVMERCPDPVEPSKLTMRLRDEARAQLGIREELCYATRDRKVTDLEVPI